MKFILIWLLTLFSESIGQWSRVKQLGSQNNEVIGIDIDFNSTRYLSILLAILSPSNNSANVFGRKIIAYEENAIRNNDIFVILDKEHYTHSGLWKWMDSDNIGFLVQGFARSSNGGSCNEQDTTGCNDLAFFETNPSRGLPRNTIRRPNLKIDAYHRVCPSKVYLNEANGRDYLFYLRYNESVAGSQIAYVTFSPFFQRHSAERLLFPSRVANYGLTSFVTSNFERSTVHIAWFENKHDLMISSTFDGLKWKEPKKIQEGVDISPLYSSTSFVEKDSRTKTLFISFFGKDKSGQIIISEDEGETWSQPYQTTEADSDSLKTAFCAERIFILSLKFQRPYLSVFNVKTKNINSLEPPFKNIQDISQVKIACTNIANKFTLGVLCTTGPTKRAYYQIYKGTL